MADSKGYYADAGFGDVTFNAGPGATENLVASGKADFGLTNAVTVGQVVANEDAPIKIVGTTFQKNPFTILSLKDGANIETIEDLKGKKIGVQDGGNGLLFDALLAANGLDRGRRRDRAGAVRPAAAGQRRGRRVPRVRDQRVDHRRRRRARR